MMIDIDDDDEDDDDNEGCFLKPNLNKSSEECKLVCLIKGELALVLASFLSGDDDDDDNDDGDDDDDRYNDDHPHDLHYCNCDDDTGDIPVC